MEGSHLTNGTKRLSPLGTSIWNNRCIQQNSLIGYETPRQTLGPHLESMIEIRTENSHMSSIVVVHTWLRPKPYRLMTGLKFKRYLVTQKGGTDNATGIKKRS